MILGILAVLIYLVLERREEIRGVQIWHSHWETTSAVPLFLGAGQQLHTDRRGPCIRIHTSQADVQQQTLRTGCADGYIGICRRRVLEIVSVILIIITVVTDSTRRKQRRNDMVPQSCGDVGWVNTHMHVSRSMPGALGRFKPSILTQTCFLLSSDHLQKCGSCRRLH